MFKPLIFSFLSCGILNSWLAECLEFLNSALDVEVADHTAKVEDDVFYRGMVWDFGREEKHGESRY